MVVILQSSILVSRLISFMHQFTQKDFDLSSLLLRVALGSYFIIASLAQLVSYAGFTNYISGYAIVPYVPYEGVQGVMAALFPWIELTLGLLLVLGLATTLAALFAALITFLFALINGFVEGTTIARDVLFIMVALSLMLMGGGGYSLDGKVRKKSKRVGSHKKDS